MNFFYPIILLILAGLIPNRTEVFSSTTNILFSAIYFICIFIFLINSRSCTKNWLRFDVLFLIGFTIVHIQLPLTLALDISTIENKIIWYDPNIVNYATWLSVVSITLWMWGYSSYKKNIRNKPIHNLKIPNNKKLLLYDTVLIICLSAFMLTVGPSVYAGIYDGGTSWGVGGTYIYFTLNCLISLRVIYFASSFKRDEKLINLIKALYKNKIFFISLISYISIFLYIGDRGPILKVLLFISGSYAIFIKPIKFKTLTIYILAGSLVFTIVGFGRTTNSQIASTENIFERGYKAFTESSETRVTDELAHSNKILYIALKEVPENHTYLYGFTYLMALITVFPFLSGQFVKLFNIDPMYRATDEFITRLVLGDHPGWGLGGEVIADIYINFGVYGVFVIMFLFGRFSSYSFSRLYCASSIAAIIYLCLLSEALSINRGMLLYPLKPIVYMLVLNYIFTRDFNINKYYKKTQK